MNVVLAGSHGLLGTALVAHLARRGHRVRRLVRRPAATSREIGWDPVRGRLDPADLRGVDAVVNLGGAGLGDHRWTRRYRDELVRSRVVPTDLLARTLAGLEDGPAVLLQASAVGFYGDRGDEVLDESSTGGEDFLGRLCRSWEAATQPAADAGVRTVLLRTGIVATPDGGAIGRLLPLMRLGLGATLGTGRNYWAWITLEDHVRAVDHLLTSAVHGPVNLTGPEPARQAEVVRALARRLRRPAVLRVPRLALRIGLGPFADDVLASQRALPNVLLGDGFSYAHPDLDSAADWITGRTGAPR